MSDRRKIVGEKLFDLGNFVAVALVFGQAGLEKKDTLLVIIGVAFTIFFWLLGWLALGKKGGKKQ